MQLMHRSALVAAPTADMPGCDQCKVKDKDRIQCEICKAEYHYKCCKTPVELISEILEFHCKPCAKTHGPSVERARPKRRRIQYNYAQLDKGVIEVNNTHMHVSRFFEEWPQHPFPVVLGTQVTSLETPVIIPAKDYATVGMEYPEGIDAAYVADKIGRDTPLPVTDVVTQDILPGWTLGSWVDYLKNPDHRKTLNVISLEFSRTPLRPLVQRPQYVRDNDLVDKIWPQGTPGKPDVGYYCLMGVAGSYTDFHVDFGGTSVYYHIIKGAKTFLFVPPTDANLKAYERWCMDHKHDTKWFPETLRKNECYRVDLQAGDTMLLPSGWIHAVYTPKDSFVIGGNFLSTEFLRRHLKVNSLEQRIETPKKFTFPNFLKCLHYLQDAASEGTIDLDEDTRALLDDYVTKAQEKSVEEEKTSTLEVDEDLIKQLQSD